MHRFVCTLFICTLLQLAAGAAEKPLDLISGTRGIIVQWGLVNGPVINLSKIDRRCQVQLLGKNVDAVHQDALVKCPAQEISVSEWDKPFLPYADNTINVLVVEVPLDDQATHEVMRVLVPGGEAFIRKKGQYAKVMKPVSVKLDGWSHWLHGADGNPVSKDQISEPPTRIQWLANPKHGRSHDIGMSMTSLVSSNGRLFYFIDEGPVGMTNPGNRVLEDWKLICRDAYNGAEIWKKPITDWGMQAWNKEKSFGDGYGPWAINPRMIHKRIVALPDRLLATLGFNAPVSVLNSRSGDPIRTIPGTEFASEIIALDNVAYIVADVAAQKAGRYTKSPLNQIMKVDPESGVILWRSHNIVGVEDKRSRALQGTLSRLQIAAADAYVFYIDHHEIAALNAASGKVVWRRPRAKIPASIPKAWKHPIENPWDLTSLMCADGLLYFWQAQSQPKEQNAYRVFLKALSVDTGKEVWKKECGTVTFRSSLPFLYIAQGLLWVEQLTGRGNNFKSARKLTGLNPKTGEPVKSHDVGVIFNAGHHHRCYPNKATERYMIYSRRGLEYVDLKTGEIDITLWERGMCQYGILPANGLLYSPPNPCACFASAQINATAAYAGKSAFGGHAVNADQRLVNGAASPDLDAASPAAWPMYRHDALRSAAAKQPGPQSLNTVWTALIGEPVSAPTIGEGRVFIAGQRSRRMLALDAATGKIQWSVRTEGRVDTPPTLAGDSLYFGTRDGYVYCLKQADGALCWRFNANPAFRRIPSFGKIESAWPVHGSVLVCGKSVIVVAGRSTYVDGGLHFYKLDARSGAVQLHKNVATNSMKDDVKNSKVPASPVGASEDLLIFDGNSIYLRNQVLSMDDFSAQYKIWTTGVRANFPGPALSAIGGFLDDSHFDREGWCLNGQYGKIFAFNEKDAYWMQWTAQHNTWHLLIYEADKHKYTICSAPKRLPRKSAPPRRKKGKKRKPVTPPKPSALNWANPIGTRVQALGLASNALFVAGTPAAKDAQGLRDAIAGKHGGVLQMLALKTGKLQSSIKLPAVPMWDGMAIANQTLFVCLKDGRVMCIK